MHTLVGRAKKLERFLLQMKKSSKLWELQETFREIKDGELDEDMDPLGMQAFDAEGDIGVEEWKEMSMIRVGVELGLDASGRVAFPNFHSVMSDIGMRPAEIKEFLKIRLPEPPATQSDDDVRDYEERLAQFDAEMQRHPAALRRFWPHWHQLVGLAAIVKRFFEGSNVLLADGVGIGKTITAFMVASYMRALKKDQTVPRFSKWTLPQSV